MLTWRPASLIAAIVLTNVLVLGAFGVAGFTPEPAPRATSYPTYTPNALLIRHYVSPTATPTPTHTPGPTSVFNPGIDKF